MHPFGVVRTMALVACAMLALSHTNVVYAFDSENHSGSGKPESSSSSGSNEHSGQSDKPDSPSGPGGGGEDGGESTDKPDTGSQGSTQNSGNSTVSKHGIVANQDEALSAVTAGEAVSLPLLLAFMANKFPGEIVDIKLKNKEGQYSYEVEYLSNTAKLLVVTLNAKTLGTL